MDNNDNDNNNDKQLGGTVGEHDKRAADNRVARKAARIGARGTNTSAAAAGTGTGTGTGVGARGAVGGDPGVGTSTTSSVSVSTDAATSREQFAPLGESIGHDQHIKTKLEKFWEIKSTGIATDDPLLGCLLVLTRIEHRPFSAESLTAGLPLANNKLTPELFIRSAERAGFSAQLIKRPLREISPLVLPAVLLLANQQACLLTAIKKNGIMHVIQPETGVGLREIKLENLEKQYIGYAIFTRPSYKFDTRSKLAGFKKQSERWFYNVMIKMLPLYYEVILASLLVNIFALVGPLFAMNVYDRVVPNNAVETLIVLAVGVITVYCFDFIMKMLRSYFIDTAGKKADILLSATIFEHMLGIKMDSRPESVGSFANNIGQFDGFRDFMTSATLTAIIDLPFLVIFLIVIYYVGGPLMWVTIVVIPIVIIAGLMIQGPLNDYVKESYRYTSQKQAMLIESLVGIENIKTTSAEGPLQRRWEHIGGLLAKVLNRSKFLSNLAVNISSFSMQISGVFIIIVGVKLISEGKLTMGALIACNMLNSRALQPLGQIASLITRYHQSMTSFKSVDNMMKMQLERPHGKTPLHRENIAGEIEFRDVSFKYPRQEELALDGVSFKISPGEKVGIIGKVGSGKTTLGKLIIGLYTPKEGSILFDGIEAQQLDLAFIRHNIGYVPQDTVLFYGTVKDNIVMGAPYSDDAAVLQAASIAGVTEFVSQHQKGFDMSVGERGDRLSGGQRQSVAIARALLLEPRIIILDEPTNSMDSRTEEMFKFKFKQSTKDKTVILITHKGSMLNIVDRLIMLEQGQIVADGPREIVIEKLATGKIKEPAPRNR